jgi:hypothetical protein
VKIKKPEKNILADENAQMSIEGIFTGIVSAMVYLMAAGYLFGPIYNTLSPAFDNVPGGYGAMSLGLILLWIYVVMPLLLVAGSIYLIRPSQQIVVQQ